MTTNPESNLIPLGDDRREWLARMLLIRRFEEAGEDWSLRGKIPAGVHPSIGQEGVAVGVLSALDVADPIAATHRSHHHALARGTAPGYLMAELFGRATGMQGGRGGSMHVGDFSLNNFGGNGIVGAGVGVAMGAALGISLAGDQRVAVGFTGDGGANVGRLWEFVNLAAIGALPLIVVLENNLYAVETHIDRMLGGGSITDRAKAFGATAVQVDGQDVGAVHEATRAARQLALEGGGPSFIEAMTYRYRGHGSGEKANYRTADEIENWRTSSDPIDRLAASLIDSGEATKDDIDALETAAKQAVDDAVAFADASPEPDPSTVALGVDAWSTTGGTR